MMTLYFWLTSLMTLNQHKNRKLCHVSFDINFWERMLNRPASLAMSTSVLKALPGKLDNKRHSPSILYSFSSLATTLVYTAYYDLLTQKCDVAAHLQVWRSFYDNILNTYLCTSCTSSATSQVKSSTLAKYLPLVAILCFQNVKIWFFSSQNLKKKTWLSLLL